MASGPTQEATRFLIAIVLDQGEAYFIKASDQPDKLEGLIEGLRQVTQGMRIQTAGEVDWSLPDGWEAQPGSGISMAVLQAPGPSGDVRFVVTRLPGPGSAEALPSFLTSNLNRWRGQLGLAPSEPGEAGSAWEEVPRPGSEFPAYLLDLQNSSAASGAAANSGGEGSAAEPGSQPSAEVAPVPTSVRYQLPEGWVDEGARGMRAASFRFEGNGEGGEVSVIVASGELLANLERWQKELTPSAEAEALTATARSVQEAALPIESADALPGAVYSLRAGEGGDQPAITAAIFPVGESGSSIFVKMKGSQQLVEAQRERFLQLVRSLAW
jgi:hypothetical protein